MLRRVPNLSWQVKLPTLLVIFATIPLVTMAAWMFGLLTSIFERTTIEALEALASTKTQAIEQFTTDRSQEIERISQLIADKVVRVVELEAKASAGQPKEVLPELQDAEALPTPDERELETAAAAEVEPPLLEPKTQEPSLSEGLSALRRELRLILWDQQRFEELLVITADGQVVTSTFTEHEGTTASDLEYFKNGLGATHVQPVFFSPLTEHLTTVIATPIRNSEAQVIAVLAARLNLTRFFRLINDTTGLGDTGETVVGQEVDGAVRFMAPTRHDPEAALTRQIANDERRFCGLLRAARGESGSGALVDYRGQDTYAAWKNIPTLNWGLVVKLDRVEALRPVLDARDQVMWFGAGLALLALAFALLVARSLVRPLAELKSATERISKGDFDVQLNIPPSDEVGELAESFERMVAAIRFFRERSRETEEEPLSDKEGSISKQ